MTRRFLFTTTAGYGHLHPLVPLARALQQAGHQVAFAAREGVRLRIESAGFLFFPVGTNREDDAEYQAFKPIRDALPPTLETEIIVYPRIFCGIAGRLMAPGIVEVGQSWKPDMLIREGGEYGGLIAAEYLGLPLATVSFAAALKTMSVFEQHAAERIDPVRALWNLPPDPKLIAPYRYLYLAYSPPSFSLQDVGWAGQERLLPATTHFIRPQFFDNVANEALPAWIERLPEQPTVYVTLGTEVNRDPEFYPGILQTIIEGLRDAPINLIVTLGRGNDPADFGPQPENVHIEPYLAQTLLLPYCDLMVMHGGSNSLLAALDVGLPMVVVPLIADQFFNAHVTEKVNLGRVVQREQLTPSAIRAAVDQVLANPMYRETAKRLQGEMHALPDQSHAVELVERVAEDRVPVVNSDWERRKKREK